jgi:uncharacterized protein YbjQ (UPF0145 family)
MSGTERQASSRESIQEAVRKLAAGGYIDSGRDRKPVTSDLTIDEALVLHSVEWEPVELVSGVGTYSIPQGAWRWVVGEIEAASYAHEQAVTAAARRLEQECSRHGGHGVVGVRVEAGVERHHVNVVMVGTAVKPSGSAGPRGAPFVSDLSGRDFALLHHAGWEPRGLAFGASFVNAPRRSAGATLAQARQNVELTNYTNALYAARESAMERMQASALGLGASGVVAVRVSEGPMPFAHHAIRFTAWGTAVRLTPGGHQYLAPQVVVPMDDASPTFEATALRGD